MGYEFTTLGAVISLAVAILLVMKKVQPTYSLILGALIGGIIKASTLQYNVSAAAMIHVKSTIIAVVVYLIGHSWLGVKFFYFFNFFISATFVC